MRRRHLIVKRDFFFNLFEQQTVPEPIDSIEYRSNLGVCLLQQDNSQVIQDNKVFFSIKSVPEYISANVNSNYTIETVKQYHKGYAIILEENFADIDDYLKFKFKSKAREIRRYVKRLETCYDITYKMYFGDISQNQYEDLFKALHNMLTIRFKQKNQINDRLLEWKRLKNLFFPLINSNKASIFVIYEANTPISISLNYIFDKIYFNAIASYNINYSKFGLGNVMIYKQLQWCLKYKFKLYEMGRGDYEYKLRWSNYTYSLEHYMATPKKATFLILMLSKVEFLKISLMEYLRSKKVNIFYNHLRSFLFRLRNSDQLLIDYQIKSMAFSEKPESMVTVNFEDEQFLKLQKPINDFLFSNALYKKNIKVYKHGEAYILEGINTCQKVVFK